MQGDSCGNWQKEGVGADTGAADATEDCVEMARPCDQWGMVRQAMKEVMRMIRNKKLAEAVTATLTKGESARDWRCELLTNLKQLGV
jgi:hypothetical protein